MAYNHPSAFLLIALIFFATANPLAHGQLGPNLGSLSVTGNLCCTSTGNCPGQPISGALVSLNCSRLLGASVILGQNTTDVNGRFNITVPNRLGLVLSQTTLVPCQAVVNLPLNQTICPVLSTANGVLVGVLEPVSALFTGLLGWLVSTRVTLFANVGA